MEIRVIRADDEVTYVALSGRMDHNGVQRVESEFNDLVADRGKPAVVDLSEVTFVVSLGVRLLLSAAKTLGAYGAKMALLKPQPLVAETLRLAKLDEVFVLAGDEAAALEAVAGN